MPTNSHDSEEVPSISPTQNLYPLQFNHAPSLSRFITRPVSMTFPHKNSAAFLVSPITATSHRNLTKQTWTAQERVVWFVIQNSITRLVTNSIITILYHAWKQRNDSITPYINPVRICTKENMVILGSLWKQCLRRKSWIKSTGLSHNSRINLILLPQ
jgi:hypothetical protein